MRLELEMQFLCGRVKGSEVMYRISLTSGTAVKGAAGTHNIHTPLPTVPWLLSAGGLDFRMNF